MEKMELVAFLVMDKDLVVYDRNLEVRIGLEVVLVGSVVDIDLDFVLDIDFEEEMDLEEDIDLEMSIDCVLKLVLEGYNL